MSSSAPGAGTRAWSTNEKACKGARRSSRGNTQRARNDEPRSRRPACARRLVRPRPRGDDRILLPRAGPGSHRFRGLLPGRTHRIPEPQPRGASPSRDGLGPAERRSDDDQSALLPGEEPGGPQALLHRAGCRAGEGDRSSQPRKRVEHLFQRPGGQPDRALHPLAMVRRPALWQTARSHGAGRDDRRQDRDPDSGRSYCLPAGSLDDETENSPRPVSRAPRCFAAALAAALASPLSAQDYPKRPIRFMIGFAPGGSADIVSRLLGQNLAERLGQPVIAEQKMGASGLLANDVVAKAPPNGHTLVLLTGGHPVAAVVMKERPYDPVRDFAMVSVVTGYPMVISVAVNSPTRTFADLITRAKTGRITFATSGPGSLHDLVGELVNVEAGIGMVSVPFKDRK